MQGGRSGFKSLSIHTYRVGEPRRSWDGRPDGIGQARLTSSDVPSSGAARQQADPLVREGLWTPTRRNVGQWQTARPGPGKAEVRFLPFRQMTATHVRTTSEPATWANVLTSCLCSSPDRAPACGAGGTRFDSWERHRGPAPSRNRWCCHERTAVGRPARVAALVLATRRESRSALLGYGSRRPSRVSKGWPSGPGARASGPDGPPTTGRTSAWSDGSLRKGEAGGSNPPVPTRRSS